MSPAYTHWSFPLCSKPSIRREVLSNGTLVNSQATADDSGLYQCNARFGEEKLVANVTLSVPRGNIQNRLIVIAVSDEVIYVVVKLTRVGC